MTDTLRSGIYCRQSKDHLVGIGNQLKANEKLAADRGYEVVARLSDNDISASKSRKRPGYEKLMAMVRAGELDVVQVTQMDRLYRQPIELENIIPQIEAAGVLIATAREGDMNLKIDTDQLRARVQVAFARAEVQRKANRQIVANEEAAKRGKRNISGARPFGYAANRIDPLEPEAQAVRDAVDSVLRGGSVNGIARRWSKLGLRPPLAPFGPLVQNPWKHRSVRHILMNPHIAGLRAYRGVIVATGDWVPLVTAEKWEAAQMVLADPARVKPRGALSLLGGIAECRCGSEVKHATRPQRGRAPGYGTYRCAAYEKEGHVASGPHVCVKRIGPHPGPAGRPDDAGAGGRVRGSALCARRGGGAPLGRPGQGPLDHLASVRPLRGLAPRPAQLGPRGSPVRTRRLRATSVPSASPARLFAL